MHVRRPLTIHPLLVAIYPILYLYATNVDRVSFTETLMPLAVSLGMTSVFFVLLRLLFGDSNKAGILSSATLILFFSYGHACEVLKVRRVAIWDWAPDRHGYLVILWGLLFLLAVLSVVRIRNDLRRLTTCVSVVSAFLVAAPLVTIAIHTVRHVGSGARRPTPEKHIQPEVPDKLPDIYYIILDSYGRADILRRVFGYDNGEFIKRLTAKGFYVALRSRSNYSLTFLSLASSLNMEYLNDLRDELGPESTDMTIVSSMIEDNRVQRALRATGYRFLHFSSGYGPTDYNRLADINYRSGVDNDFRIMLLQTTMLSLVQPHYGAQKRARTLFAFETIKEIPQIEDPTFAFAHLMIPHFPFVFDRYCDPQPRAQGVWGFRGEDDLKAYVDQLICVNKMVEALLDEILATSEVPPIIILQADHGPSEEMGIFNALYLPEDGQSQLYAGITPVNTFRLIFDFYFGTKLGLLEDRSYLSTYVHPYEFIEIVE